MDTIPLRPTANQTFQVVLGGQNCSLRVYTRQSEAESMVAVGGISLFVDLAVNEQVVASGVIAREGTPLLRYPRLGFDGDLLFIDMQGAADPQWSGLGDRWRLLWLSADEIQRYEAGTL
ncbi:MAG: hypothetical protein PHI96_00780 [Desulfovibrio sp.]|nr:hypothetical protein [Desulfovibrio sp.]